MITTVGTRDGRGLVVEEHGQGQPVVVLESGMGASRAAWTAVAPALAQATRTVTYDRAGLGASPPDPAGRGLGRLADDLVDVLDHLGNGPFVLVGHSWGGPIVRVAASRVPERIAGLVLVDATDEGCDLYFRPNAERDEARFARLLPALARLGLVRFGLGRVRGTLSDVDLRALKATDGSVAAARGHQAELASCTADLRAVRDDPPPVPDAPVTVISGTKRARFGQARRDALVAAHRARADAHPQGRWVGAGASGHFVPFTEPDLVVTEIRRLVDRSGA